MPQRWGICFGVDGDLRFASHHDMMRTITWAAARAQLPMRYSQGFNPRPHISLPCPRPVGVTSRDDLLVLTLADESDIAGPEIIQRLNAAVPEGMTCLSAALLKTKSTPLPRSAEYELTLPAEFTGHVKDRLAELAEMPGWQIQRYRTPSQGRRESSGGATVDIKPLVRNLRLDGTALRWTLVPSGDIWARPAELLGMLELDAQVMLAHVVRLAVEYSDNQTMPEHRQNDNHES